MEPTFASRNAVVIGFIFGIEFGEWQEHDGTGVTWTSQWSLSEILGHFGELVKF